MPCFPFIIPANRIYKLIDNNIPSLLRIVTDTICTAFWVRLHLIFTLQTLWMGTHIREKQILHNYIHIYIMAILECDWAMVDMDMSSHTKYFSFRRKVAFYHVPHPKLCKSLSFIFDNRYWDWLDHSATCSNHIFSSREWHYSHLCWYSSIFNRLFFPLAKPSTEYEITTLVQTIPRKIILLNDIRLLRTFAANPLNSMCI